MITTGSKFFYALAGVLLVAAVVYGYSTGGGGVGPISVGYSGGVGDHMGYGILLVAAVASLFAGFCATAYRDADAEAGAELLGVDTAPTPAAAAPSYWPIIGAFGATMVVVGLVLNNVFFVIGLVVLGAVAVEWVMQTWSERASGDPAVNRELRNRMMFPLEVPLGGALVILLVVVGYSRVFLAVSALGAVWIAMGIATVVFGLGTLLSVRPSVRTDLLAGLLAIGAVVTIGAGVVAGVSGEREFHDLGAEHGEGSADHTDVGSGEDAESENEEGAVGAGESN